MRIVARIYKLKGNCGTYVRTHKNKHFRININEHPTQITCIENGDILDYSYAVRNLSLECFVLIDEFNREFTWSREEVKSNISMISNAYLDSRGSIRFK